MLSALTLNWGPRSCAITPNPGLRKPGGPRKQLEAPEAVPTVSQGHFQGRARSRSDTIGVPLENRPGGFGNTQHVKRRRHDEFDKVLDQERLPHGESGHDVTWYISPPYQVLAWGHGVPRGDGVPRRPSPLSTTYMTDDRLCYSCRPRVELSDRSIESLNTQIGKRLTSRTARVPILKVQYAQR